MAELKKEVERSNFPKDAEIKADMQFSSEVDGDHRVFTVTGVEGDKVKIDGNHPLAGQTLHFDVEVVEIRNATSEELEHGHVHGPGGHDHH